MANCTNTIGAGPSTAEARALIAEGLQLLARGAAVWIVAVADGIVDRLDRARERRVLSGFDDRALADLGLNRCDVDVLTR